MILQVALGIVLGLIVFTLLPYLTAAAIVVLALAIALALVLAVLFFAVEYIELTVFVLIVASTYGGYYLYASRHKEEYKLKQDIKALKGEMAPRRIRGYEDAEKESQLEDLQRSLKAMVLRRKENKPTVSKYRSEKEKRRALGYEE